MDLFFDIPYDWYDHLNLEHMFVVAKHVDEVTKIQRLAREHWTMIDNGAWPGDGGKAMCAEEYDETIEHIHADVVVWPDTLGDVVETKYLAEKFNEVHIWDDNITYIFPLQGDSIEKFKYMQEWYKQVIIPEGCTNYIWGLSKGTTDMKLPNRMDSMNACKGDFHWFGYNYGCAFHKRLVALDTKLPIKKVLQAYLSGPVMEEKNYYSLKWGDLKPYVHDLLKYHMDMFAKSIEAKVFRAE